jgi:lysophospholipase L1-like esterase
MSKQLNMGLWIAILFLLNFGNCIILDPIGHNEDTSFASDTPFQVDQVAFPNDTFFSNSIISTGNNHRLWEFFKKASNGATVTIGFIGGSITGGAMASAQHDFATLFCTYLEKKFPAAGVLQKNAGIGATDSRFGCSRIQDDLFSKTPDLIVVEFAVNDNESDSAGTLAAMEGLVRQCLQKEDVPVFLLFLMDRTGSGRVQSWHAMIGRHYGIPMISYRDACWSLIQAGRLHPDSIFADDIHPNNNGHRICAYLLSSFIKKTFGENNVNAPFTIPAPLSTDLFQNGGIFKTNDTILTILSLGGWSEVVREQNRVGFYCLHPGESLRIFSRARELTVGYQRSSSHETRAQVVIDGVAVDTLSSFFKENFVYMGTKRIFWDSESKSRTIQFVNLDPDSFVIDYLLYAK